MKSDLAYGGSEGICLDLWTEYLADSKRCSYHMGIFNMPDQNNEAMYIMANLLSDLIIEEYAYVNADPDGFTWEVGMSVPNDVRGWHISRGCFCSSMKAALEEKVQLLKIIHR